MNCLALHETFITLALQGSVIVVEVGIEVLSQSEGINISAGHDRALVHLNTLALNAWIRSVPDNIMDKEGA